MSKMGRASGCALWPMMLAVLLLCVLLRVASASSRRRRQTPVQAQWQCPSSVARTRSSSSLARLAIHLAGQEEEPLIGQSRAAGWKGADVDRLLKAGFELDKPTLVYTHGYTQTIQRAWLKEVRRNYDSLHARAQRAHFNLLLFDWSDYGQRAYGSSVSYVPYLGRVLAQFLHEHLFKRYNYSASRVHLVSYSLSAHIAGAAGRRLRAASNPLGQITALDPTGVCFHGTNSEFALKYQLRASDAQLVLAQHYDMGGLGARKPIGGLDVLVNGGSSQPSVWSGAGPAFALVGSVASAATSHRFASLHESAPPNASCHEIAYACPSWQAYLAGQCADCGNRSASKCYRLNAMLNMEQQLEQARDNNYKQGTKMYVATGISRYCQHNYQLLVQLAKSASSADLQALESGAVSLLLKPLLSAADQQAEIRAAPSNKLSSRKFTQLLQLEQKIEQFPNRIQVDAPKDFKLSSLASLQFNYMSNISADERKRASARYCPKGASELVRC